MKSVKRIAKHPTISLLNSCTTLKEMKQIHAQLVVKGKCSFAQKQIEYLGHVVSDEWVQPLSDNVQAIQQWPQPRTTRALCGFLGLAGFYQRFIRSYATLAAPLSCLLTKEEFNWTLEVDVAFKNLKHAMTHSPVLALPDFTKSFMVETNASGSGMGAVVS